jgi:hypothetical protein
MGNIGKHMAKGGRPRTPFRMKRPLRKSDIEYEIDDDDVSYLCRNLAITVQAARALLTNQNPLAVRTLIETRGAHLSKAQRADIVARIAHIQDRASRRKRSASA